MMGFWDAVVRVIVGVIFIWLGIEKGGAFVIAEIFGFILLFTAVIAFCPLYKLAGVSSKCEECEPA
ncbi:YgaP family membrane protein [Persephonella sp.]|jgi:hypothetical protein